MHVYIRQLSVHPEWIRAGCESEVLCQRSLEQPGDFWFENLKVHQLEGNHLELMTQAFEAKTAGLLPEARSAVAREVFPEGAVQDNVQRLTGEFEAFLRSHPVDLIHVHNSYVIFPQVLYNLRSLLAQLKIAVIFSVHSAPFKVHLSETETVHLYHFLRECQAVFDVVHAVSREVQNRLRAEVGVESRVMYIGVDPQRFRPAAKDTQLLNRLGLSPRHKIMLSVGRLTSEKGLADFVDAVLDLHERLDENIIGLIIGDGPYRGALEAMIAQRAAGSTVCLLAPVDNQQLPAYYNLADVFMFLSHREALGLVLLEAMACERLCIVSNLPATGEVISDCVNGYLVAPQDTGQIRRIVQAHWESQDQRRLTSSARETVLSGFNFETHITELLSVYAQVEYKKKHADFG
jgi:glycosyltransferase involved in cell wall biosynthesis